MKSLNTNTFTKILLIVLLVVLGLAFLILGGRLLSSKKTTGEERLVLDSSIPSLSVELADKDRALSYLDQWSVFSDGGVSYYDTDTGNARRTPKIDSVQILLTNKAQIAGPLSSKLSNDYVTVSSFSTDTSDLDNGVFKVVLFVNSDYLRSLDESQRDVYFSNLVQQELYMIFHPSPVVSPEQARDGLTSIREEVLKGPAIYKAIIK